MNQNRQEQVGIFPLCSEKTAENGHTRNNEERPYGHDRSVPLQPQLSSYQYPAAYNFGNSNGLPNLPNIQKTLEMFRTSTQFQQQQELQPLPLSIPITVPPTEKNEKGLRRGKWTVSHAKNLSS